MTWKVCYTDDRYEISDLGEVRNKETGKLRKLQMGTNGYLQVALCGKLERVHRLVLEAFYGPSKLICNHKDGDKHNNNLSNLEYCTRSYNARHAIAMGLKKYDRKPVYIKDKYGKITKFNSAHDAAKHLNASKYSIDDALRGRNKTLFGHVVSHNKRELSGIPCNPPKEPNKVIYNGKLYKNMCEASKDTNVSSQMIWYYCNKAKDCKGWSYV